MISQFVNSPIEIVATATTNPDRTAFRSQSQRDRAPNPTASACDERSLACYLEIHCHRSLSSTTHGSVKG